MQLEVNGSTISISGNIKSVQDFQDIKSAIDRVAASSSVIHFELLESMSMTSSVIGYISKVIHKDGVSVTMLVKDNRLYDLLSDLGLINLFNVKKKN